MAASDFETAVSQTITTSNQFHNVINGSTTDTITTDSGEIPSLRKSLTDNFFFLDPIDWVEGENSTKFNQLYKYTDGLLWYAPAATTSNPIPLGASPTGDSNWLISPFNITTTLKLLSQPRQYGDGVNATFDSPAKVKVSADYFSVAVDGILQSTKEDFDINDDGKVVFISGVPPKNSSVDVKYNQVGFHFDNTSSIIQESVQSEVGLDSLKFTPVTDTSVSNSSLFVDIEDGRLKFKDGEGNLITLYE